MVLPLLVQQVYQSLDRELQKHVNHQDTLQQCQTWLSTVQEELQLNDQGPSGLQEALKQVIDTELVLECNDSKLFFHNLFRLTSCTYTGEALQGPSGAGQYLPGLGVFCV